MKGKSCVLPLNGHAMVRTNSSMPRQNQEIISTWVTDTIMIVRNKSKVAT